MKTNLEKNGNSEYNKIGMINDVVFKIVFGSEGSTALLLDVINAVLEHSNHPKITSVSLKNPVVVGERFWLKRPELDILAVDENGKTYDVEIQSYDDTLFIKRSLFYLRKQYVSQLKRGNKYEKLHPVIGINFVKENVLKSRKEYHNWYVLANEKDSSDILDTDITVHFIELSKLDKENSSLAQWVELFKRSTGYETIKEIEPLLKRSKQMREAYSRYKNCTQEEALFLEAMRVQRWDSDPRFMEKEFIAKGEKKGLRKGLKQGLEKGIEKGAHKKAVEVARSMKQNGVDVASIIKYTGLAEAEILAIDNS